MEIKKDMLIGDVVKKHPETAMIMMENGLHCVGCHVSAFETVEQGARAHGISDDDIDRMVDKMNEVVKDKEGDKDGSDKGSD